MRNFGYLQHSNQGSKLHTERRSSSFYAKRILLIVCITIFMMWMMQPFLRNKNNVMPHHYFSYGMACLQHYMQAINQHNYKLMNTYAKSVHKNKNIVLIQAKNLHTSEQIKIECGYEDRKLSSLHANNEKVNVDSIMLLEKN